MGMHGSRLRYAVFSRAASRGTAPGRSDPGPGPGSGGTGSATGPGRGSGSRSDTSPGSGGCPRTGSSR